MITIKIVDSESVSGGVSGMELLDVLSFFQSLMFKLLKDRPADREWFMRKLRERYESEK